MISRRILIATTIALRKDDEVNIDFQLLKNITAKYGVLGFWGFGVLGFRV